MSDRHGQGYHFTEAELQKILHLLESTELTMPEIALRMNCSRTNIIAINARFKVRVYAGKRLCWTLADGRVIHIC